MRTYVIMYVKFRKRGIYLSGDSRAIWPSTSDIRCYKIVGYEPDARTYPQFKSCSCSIDRK